MGGGPHINSEMMLVCRIHTPSSGGTWKTNALTTSVISQYCGLSDINWCKSCTQKLNMNGPQIKFKLYEMPRKSCHENHELIKLHESHFDLERVIQSKLILTKERLL